TRFSRDWSSDVCSSDLVLVVFGLLPSENDKDLIKRVVGVGGDRVQCCDRQGRVSVNGVPLEENDYLYPGNRPSTIPFDITVPERSEERRGGRGWSSRAR